MLEAILANGPLAIAQCIEVGEPRLRRRRSTKRSRSRRPRSDCSPATDDKREGTRAFLEKRAASFTRRVSGTGGRGATRLDRLVVRDFRNLEHVELELAADGLVIVGDNGQGKTNLLESIYYLGILRSARGARDQDLVRFGADAFHIAASVETNGCHEIGVGFERAGKRKRVRLDGDVPERLSDALGALPSVMFSPSDVELVAGSPNARRRISTSCSR